MHLISHAPTATARYYAIGGMTLVVSSDLPITDDTFGVKFTAFQVDGPGDDVVFLRHHFSLPDPAALPVGQVIADTPPWRIELSEEGWLYRCILPDGETVSMVARFSPDHRIGDIYHQSADQYLRGDWHSLTLFPTDQLLLSALLAERQGCIIHSAGMIIDGHGLLFVGHSDAGKSTTVTMLKEMGTILCDDRNIVRRMPEGFQVYGTWSHGTVSDIARADAPLKALCFLEQSSNNALISLTDKREIIHRLLLTLIKPFVTTDWWDKSFVVLEQLVNEVPAYRLQLDKSGAVRQTIARLLHG